MGLPRRKKAPNAAPEWLQDAEHEGQEGSIHWALGGWGGLYIGPRMYRLPLARKIAWTWAYQAQHGLTMWQETSQCSARVVPGCRK